MGAGIGGSRALRAGRAAAGVAALVALWPAVAAAWAVDRGLGLRDEGLYLLAADPPSATARWVTPFGWHTAPFFRLLGHDVARLRTFALWTLLVVGAGAGWAVGRLVTADGRTRADRAVRAGLAVVAAAGAPLVGSGLLRTPGYNWVNLIGLLGAVAGTALAGLVPTTGSLWRSRPAHAAAALLAGGVWFAVPAKPSTAPLALAAAAAFAVLRLRRRAWPFAGLTAAWGGAWTALGVAAGWWPASFLTVFARSARFPPLHPNQTIPGALRDVLRTPKVAAHDLARLRPAAVVVLVAAAAVAAVAGRAGRACSRAAVPAAAPGSSRLRPWATLLPLVLACVAAVGTASGWPLLGEPTPPVRFAWYGASNAAVLLLVGALTHLVATRQTTAPADRRRGLLAAGVCAAAVVAFGFGSAMSEYHQAAGAAALSWCAAAAVAAVAGDARTRVVAVALMAAASLAMLAADVVDGRHRPFDTPGVAAQVVPTVVGARGDHLLLDERTASRLGGLRQVAGEAGFCPGTRLVGMEAGWTSTTAYALGARVPEHLVLTLFGYPDAARVLDVTMRDLRDPAWHDAWVLTTASGSLSDASAAEVRAALDRLPAALGRTFPDDYALVGDVDDTQLWRPLGAPAAVCG